MQSHTLISAAELEARRVQGDVLIVDCRFALADPGQGEREYLTAHIPGAVHASLDRDLSDLSQRGLGRHPLPGDDAFSATLSRWGWSPDLAVVAYDNAGGALAAARLWWMLRLAGHANVAVLDGGFGAWLAAGYPLESGHVRRAASSAQVALDRAQVVWSDELERRLVDGSVRLIDARAAERFRGDVEPIDPTGGHVPRAVNRPFAENLGAGGRFKPAAQLREEFQRVMGGRAPETVAHMCGSGVTACHNLLAMEHAGLAGARVFAPSWSGWVSDPTHPVATGDGIP